MSTALSGGARKTGFNFNITMPWDAVGNIASSLIGASASKSAAKRQQQLQWAMYLDNRNWQERMANTAHQREVQDLMAAGLNPVLSANGGATVPASTAPVLGDAPEQKGINTALAIKSMINESALRKSQVALQGSQIKNTDSNTKFSDEQRKQFVLWNPKIQKSIIDNNNASTARAIADAYNNTRLTNAQINSINANTAGQLINNRYNQKGADFYSTGYGKFIYGTGESIGAIGRLFGGGTLNFRPGGNNFYGR